MRSNDELLRSPGRNIKLRIKHFAVNSNELSQKAAQRVRSDKMRVREAIQMKVDNIYKKITSDRSQSTKRPSEVRAKLELSNHE